MSNARKQTQESLAVNRRQAQRRQRLRAAGFVPVSYWIHKSDRDRVKTYIDRINKAHKVPKAKRR